MRNEVWIVPTVGCVNNIATAMAKRANAKMCIRDRYDIGIYPDFEADKTYVKGTFLVKGHIRLVHVLISGIRLLKEDVYKRQPEGYFKNKRNNRLSAKQSGGAGDW